MENFKLEKDIHLCCLTADSFPDGITATHQKLAAIAMPFAKQNYFGVSYLYDNAILYMAAVQTSSSKETIPEGCKMYTLRKGNYISFYIKDFAKDPAQIENAFKTLLAHPAIDEQGCCAECYFPEGANGAHAIDVRCMVRLAD